MNTLDDFFSEEYSALLHHYAAGDNPVWLLTRTSGEGLRAALRHARSLTRSPYGVIPLHMDTRIPIEAIAAA